MAEELKVIYRISDKGNPKEKLPNGGKMECLGNAIKEFGRESLYVIADNCEDATIAQLDAMGLTGEIASRGNSGTMKYIINELVPQFFPGALLYLLEDDYLHLPGSREAILDGLSIADYVTLYDHPDMYHAHDQGLGPNPLVRSDVPDAKIFLTRRCHFRSTVSTTMTFACRAKTLLEDKEIFNRGLIAAQPADFYIFALLTKQRRYEDLVYAHRIGLKTLEEVLFENNWSEHPKRLLVSAVPGMATHTEITHLSPLVDWSEVV